MNKIEVKLTVALYKEDKYYVAYCPALEISSYSTTLEKAREHFAQEVRIFLDETIKKGTLEKLLFKYGINLMALY